MRKERKTWTHGYIRITSDITSSLDNCKCPFIEWKYNVHLSIGEFIQNDDHDDADSLPKKSGSQI